MIKRILNKSALLGGVIICSSALLGAGCSYQPSKISDLWNGSSKPAEVDSSIEQETLDVGLGRTFTIELSGNESTGYRWTAEHTRPNIEFIKDEYIPNSRLVVPDAGTIDGEAQPIAGAGGQHFFTFSAVEPGYAQITFSYSRSWETVKPLKQVIYSINVK